MVKKFHNKKSTPRSHHVLKQPAEHPRITNQQQAESNTQLQRVTREGQQLTPRMVVNLQRMIGNQAVQRMIAQRPVIQTSREDNFSVADMDDAQAEVQSKSPDGHESRCGCPSCTGRIQMKREDNFSVADMDDAQAEVQSKSPDGHESRCGCPSCTGRIQTKRDAGNHMLIQRDIVDDWVTESDRKGLIGKKGRSTDLKQIDTAVADYKRDHTLPALYATNIPKAENIIILIDQFLTDKPDSKRKAKLLELKTKINQELLVFQQKRDEKEQFLAEAQPFHSTFHNLSGGMSDYAGRDTSYKDVDRFHPTKMGERTTALTMYRNPDGTLSDEGIAKMNELDIAEVKNKSLQNSEEAELTIDPSLSPEDLQKLMEANLNPVTARTIYPELENILDDSKQHEVDAPVTETMDISGVSMQVTYNRSDVNFDTRIGMITAAVQQVQGAGFTVPPLTVHLPKLGRSLSINGECKIEISGETERAVYVAPNFMHISSENMFNPLGDEAADDSMGEYKFSSTGFDPSGVGTIVHELGHFLHYRQSPGKFHELWGSVFKGKDDTGKGHDAIAKEQVSEYGTKPREFVAEVFLGMVYGRAYSPEVMDMYRTFGGPAPV